MTDTDTCVRNVLLFRHHFYRYDGTFRESQTKMVVLAALVAGASAFSPAKPAFASSALFNQKTDWNSAAELGWSMGGEDYTREVKTQKHDDARKSIHEAPSFEEYMKQRQSGFGQ